MNIVEITNVSKKFKEHGKEFYAIKDVSFSIKKGEIFGLLGPNGAGKTTLISMLLGVITQDSGTIKIFGKGISPDVLERMNMVASDIRFHWVLPCRDILEYYGRVYGVEKEERAKRIEKLSRVFGIEDILDRRFMLLSTGERMRLNFAKALLNNPELLLLDEPTLGLDHDIAIKVRDEIKRVNRKFKTTIILTSHYMNEVEQMCNRIAFMHRGQIADTGSVGKIKMVNFDSYEIIIKTKKAIHTDKLKRYGFKIHGNILKKRLTLEQNISEPISFLNRIGVIIEDVEIKKPTLEDYFVKMASKSKGVGA